MGGPEPLNRVGVAEALVQARAKDGWCPFVVLPSEAEEEWDAAKRQETAAARAAAAAGGAAAARPARRAALDGKLGYRSPLDISMDSSKLEAALGWRFRPLREALAEGGGGSSSGGGGGGEAHVLRFVDALLLGLVAVAVALYLRQTPTSKG